MLEPMIESAWNWLSPYLQGIEGFVVGSIVPPIVTFTVQKWLKRPKLRIELRRIHARFEDIFNTGRLETAIAQMKQDNNTLADSNLGHFLNRYIEISVTLEDASKLTIETLILTASKRRSLQFERLLSPSEAGFEVSHHPVVDEGASRTFYLDEAAIGIPAESISRIAVKDTSGRLHSSKPISNIAALDAALSLKPLGEGILNIERERRYELKPAALWIAFGPNCENLGWHVGARMTPENGTPYQPAFDESEAVRLAQFAKQLPGCSSIEHLTVNDGVLLANADLHDKKDFFYHASRAIHITDSGIVEVRFVDPARDDLEGLYMVLVVSLSIAHYLHLSRLTWPLQRLHVGYAAGKDKELPHLPQPGSERRDTIDVSRIDFASQVAGIVVDFLRDAHGTLRDRADIVTVLDRYWNQLFPDGLSDLPPRSLAVGATKSTL